MNTQAKWMSLVLCGITASGAFGQSSSRTIPFYLTPEHRHLVETMRQRNQGSPNLRGSLNPRGSAEDDPALRWQAALRWIADNKEKTYWILPGSGPDLLTELQKESNRGCFDSVETVVVRTTHDRDANARDTLAALLLNSPKLHQLQVEDSSNGDWPKIESWLAERAATNPEFARKIDAGFRRLRVVELRLKLWNSQKTLNDYLLGLAKSKRLQSLEVTIRPDTLFDAAGKAQPRVADLRGLAAIRSLTSLTVNLKTLTQVAIAFPNGLKHLTIHEMGVSERPPEQVVLPSDLQTLTIASNNTKTRAFFARRVEGNRSVRANIGMLSLAVAQRVSDRSGMNVWSYESDWRVRYTDLDEARLGDE